ncbi:MAG TPA: hypothetical protein PLT70_10605 [bacterium]|nr:hypothetical protein [bacterium]HQN73819.1 hypothetical protein [bacterium]
MKNIITLFLSTLFFFSACDIEKRSIAIDESVQDEDVEIMNDEEMVDDEQMLEFVEITMQKVSGNLSQKAVVDVKEFKVERNLNHVDTSFFIHINDFEIIAKKLRNEIFEKGCHDCSEDENYLFAVTSKNDECCVSDEQVINEIAKYLLIPVNSMLWPFAPQDEPHDVGHTSVNIQHYTQKYEEAYFHHGVDIIKNEPEKIFNMYDGRVEKIGYYRTEEVGESKYYFEVVLQTVNGLKFEFHHTDPESVPDGIYEIEGTDIILEAGANTGKIVFWPTPDSYSGKLFHHIHFNVITQKGIKLNPLIMMIPQRDEISPKIDEIYLINSERTKTLTNSGIDEDFHVVIKVSDLADNEIWPNPPRFSKIEILNSENEVVFEHSGYDFIAMMSENINEFVCDYYLCEIGESAYSKGNYSERDFHIVVTAFDKTGNIADAIEKDLFESGEYSIKATSCDEVGNCGEKSIDISF